MKISPISEQAKTGARRASRQQQARHLVRLCGSPLLRQYNADPTYPDRIGGTFGFTEVLPFWRAVRGEDTLWNSEAAARVVDLDPRFMPRYSI